MNYAKLNVWNLGWDLFLKLTVEEKNILTWEIYLFYKQFSSGLMIKINHSWDFNWID